MIRLVKLHRNDGLGTITVTPSEAFRAMRGCMDEWTIRRAWQDMVFKQRTVYITARYNGRNVWAMEPENIQ